MRSRRIAFVAAALLALGAAALVPLTSAAATTGTAILSLNSTKDPFYASGRSQFTDTGFVQTDGQGGFIAFGNGWDVQLSPPIGTRFAPGTYTNVSNQAYGTGNAYGDISVGSGEGFDGVVDVLDWAADSRGVPTRFDIVFRTPGVNAAQGYFGEIRMGEETAGGVVLAARHLEWSPTPVGSTPLTAVEWVHNTSSKAVAIGTPTLAGDGKADYAVSSDGCSGRTLAAGARCSLLVGFSPKKAGPRIAALALPVGGAVQTVSLAGIAPLGASSLTTSGVDGIDQGRTNTWSEGGSTAFYTWYTGCGYSVGNLSPYALGDPGRQFTFVAGPRDTPPAIGTHTTTGCDMTGATLNMSAFGIGFGDPHGTETVRRFDVDANDVLTAADVSFTITDQPGKPMTGHLRYRARSDYTPPNAPTGVTVSGSTVRWTASKSSDAVSSIARLVPTSAPVASVTPTSGYPVSAGPVTSGTVVLPRSGSYRVVVFALDATGNASSAASAVVR